MVRAPFTHIFILLAFLANTFGPLPFVQAQELRLPAPGVMVRLSPPLAPIILKGIKVHTDNPFRFDFILDRGDSELSGDQLKDESTKLIKYFLASITIPEKDLWVNLSPYEKQRIIPRSFGLTEMGRDLLAEDYMLKQITASLIYPEDEFGKKFWKRVYEEAAKKYSTTDIPVDTFNKVWIVPEKAVVYENTKAGTAYVVESKLKVMLEQDYLSLRAHAAVNNDTGAIGTNIVREVVIPELTREVNENKNFAQLRQVYNSLILATWYKKKIRDSILSQVYADKNKVTGVEYTSTVIPAKAGIRFKNDVEGLYREYLKAFKKGVFNYIKEDPDLLTQKMIPRKYFSGGMDLNISPKLTYTLDVPADRAMIINPLRVIADLLKPKEGFTNQQADFSGRMNELEGRLDERLEILGKSIKTSLGPSESQQALDLLDQVRRYGSHSTQNQPLAEGSIDIYRNNLILAVSQSLTNLRDYLLTQNIQNNKEIPGQLHQVLDTLIAINNYTKFLKQMYSLKRDMEKFNTYQPELKTAVGQYQHQYEDQATADFNPNNGFGRVLPRIAEANQYMQQGDIQKALQEWGGIYGMYQAIQNKFEPILRQNTDKPTRNFMYHFFQELNVFFGEYIEYFGLKGLRGMEGGASAGRLVIVHGSEQEVLYKLANVGEGDIVVMDQDYEALASAATNAGGFIFGREGAGHIMTRARAMQVPLLNLPNAVEYLKQFDGKDQWVLIGSYDGPGVLHFLSGEERAIAPALERSPEAVKPVRPNLKGPLMMSSNELYNAKPLPPEFLGNMEKYMGYKAANLFRNKIEARVPMPRTLTLFNRFWAELLKNNYKIKRQLEEHFKTISRDKLNQQTVLQNLKEMRELIENMQLSQEQKEGIWSNLEGVNVPFLISRLSTGAEDLEDFPGVGAGVYGSIELIPWAVEKEGSYEIPQANKDNLIRKLLETYASFWSFKAYADREHFRIDHWAVGNALIIQEYLSGAKYSVLVHTAEPSTRNINIMKIEIVPGAGRALTDTDPMLQGSALTLFYDRTAKKIITKDDPRTQYHPIELKKLNKVDFKTGAIVSIPELEHSELMNEQWQSDLANEVAPDADRIESLHERAQDIEAVILIEEGKIFSIPVQSRTQGNGSTYLGGLREVKKRQRWTAVLEEWLNTYDKEGKGRKNFENFDFYKGERFEAPSLQKFVPIRNVRMSGLRHLLMQSLGLKGKDAFNESMTRFYNFLMETNEFKDVREGILRRIFFYVAMEHSEFVDYFGDLAKKPDLLLRILHYAITPLSSKENINDFDREWFNQVNSFLLVRAMARHEGFQKALPYVLQNLSLTDLVSLINQIYLSAQGNDVSKSEIRSLTNKIKQSLKGPDNTRSDYQEMFNGLIPQAQKDFAMRASNTGGIDLTSSFMNLQTQSTEEGIKFHINPAVLQQFQNTTGFVPVIINIQPMNNWRQFLGLKWQ